MCQVRRDEIKMEFWEGRARRNNINSVGTGLEENINVPVLGCWNPPFQLREGNALLSP